MLAKDYRTRISLDEIVVDDWVTSEGSQVYPLPYLTLLYSFLLIKFIERIPACLSLSYSTPPIPPY